MRKILHNTNLGIPILMRIAVPILMIACMVSCAIQDKSLTTVKIGEKIIAPKAQECGKCHIEIYEEWKGSKHALTYTSKTYRNKSLEYEANMCLPCHVPDSIFNEKIGPRRFYREEGVTCLACHLFEKKHHGPFSDMKAPHAVKANPEFYYDSSLCGKCHVVTYESWLKTKERKTDIETCQECHMESIRRKMTQATGLISFIFVAQHKEHDMRRHNFSVNLQRAKKAVKINISSIPPDKDSSGTSDVYKLTVQNLLPHTIPTGDHGFRKATLGLEFIDLVGNQSAPRIVYEFYKDEDHDTYLRVGETISITLPEVKGQKLKGGDRIRVFLKRVNQDGNELFTIADEMLTLS